MIPFSLSFAVDAVSGDYHGPQDLLSKTIDNVTIDSRSVRPGTLFVPVIGRVFDGHSFIPAAVSAGSLCVLSDREIKGTPYILVPDTTDALQRLAEAYLLANRIPVVGVTGSAGKTSTKEMLYSVLSRHFSAYKTPGNLNNQTGVPQAVFQIGKEHEVAVLELGTNHPGEIRSLARIVRPDICVITNIGVAHIEFFGSRENIFRGKTEMLEYMQPDGHAVVNGDDDFLCTLPDAVTYGLGSGNVFRAENIQDCGLDGSEFDVLLHDRPVHIHVPAPGHHMIYNALAAIAVGSLFGMNAAEISEGVSSYKPFAGRLETKRVGGITVLDDSYNANPASMRSSIDVLKYARGRKVCILGDMFELGEKSEAFHREVGRYASESGIDLVLCVGKEAEYMYASASSLTPDRCLYFNDCSSLIDALPSLVHPDDTVLVKASRGMHLEQIVQFFMDGYVQK